MPIWGAGHVSMARKGYRANACTQLECGEMPFHTGGCHCGADRFEVEAPESPTVRNCNCPICLKSGFLHVIVARSQFLVLSGEDHLTTCTFGSGVAKYLFCKVCGIKSFHIPRSNPDGFSVDLRCLDEDTIERVTVELFGGKKWEENAHKLSQLST